MCFASSFSQNLCEANGHTLEKGWSKKDKKQKKIPYKKQVFFWDCRTAKIGTCSLVKFDLMFVLAQNWIMFGKTQALFFEVSFLTCATSANVKEGIHKLY